MSSRTSEPGTDHDATSTNWSTHGDRQRCSGDEVLLANFAGEDTDFVRFNNSDVRQAGSVDQRRLSVDLIEGQRHAGGSLQLSGDRSDRRRPPRRAARPTARAACARRRRSVPALQHRAAVDRAHRSAARIPDARRRRSAEIRAAGTGPRPRRHLRRRATRSSGFANSLGQRNWFQSSTFNLDWCFYLRADKAAKNLYAGFDWDDDAFAAQGRLVGPTARRRSSATRSTSRRATTAPTSRPRRWTNSCQLLVVLRRVRTAGPRDQADTAAARCSPTTPRCRRCVNITRGHRRRRRAELPVGRVPPTRRGATDRRGRATPTRSCRRARPRSTACRPTAPSDGEYPRVGGDRARARSRPTASARRSTPGSTSATSGTPTSRDRAACRTTGMTRFATFWMDDGEIVAPVNVLRFDDTAYHLLGDQLEGLTDDRRGAARPVDLRGALHRQRSPARRARRRHALRALTLEAPPARVPVTPMRSRAAANGGRRRTPRSCRRGRAAVRVPMPW